MNYPDIVLKYFNLNDFQGTLEDSDCQRDEKIITTQSGTIDNGLLIQIQFKLKDATITDAKFLAYGNVYAIACASFMCEYCIGKTTAELKDVDHKKLMRLLGIPVIQQQCATAVIDCLQQIPNINN